LIARCPDIAVIGKASSGAEALAMFREQEPDVTMVDLRHGADGRDRDRRGDSERVPNARIIMLTSYDTDDDIYRGLKAGAASYC